MGLLDRLRRTELGLGSNSATPEQARAALAKALERQNRRSACAEAEPTQVQLVGQTTAAVEWPKLLAYWQRRNPAGTGGWPRQLDAGAYALNLWPLRPRQSISSGGGDVRKRQPKTMLATPGLTVFNPEHGGDAITAFAVVCTTWLEDVGRNDFQALRLLPPILETWAPGGRLLSRDTVTFGLEWRAVP
jgi:hypothetical protein